MVRIVVCMAFSLLLSLGQFAGAAELAGRVVGITDGDTLTLLYDGRQQVRIRLAEIDTPESRQPYGNRARQQLSDLVFGKDVRVTVEDIDRYGRTVGRVYAGSVDVNAEMVRQGAAWVYRQYSRDPMLLRHEQEARDARRGSGLCRRLSACRRGNGGPRSALDRVVPNPPPLSFRRPATLRPASLVGEAVLPRDDKLCRGPLLPHPMRCPEPGRRPRWRALRAHVSVKQPQSRRGVHHPA